MSLLFAHYCLLPGQTWKLQVIIVVFKVLSSKLSDPKGSETCERSQPGDEFSRRRGALRVCSAKPGPEYKQVSEQHCQPLHSAAVMPECHQNTRFHCGKKQGNRADDVCLFNLSVITGCISLIT